MFLTSFFKKSINYVKKYPSHYAYYVGFGTTLALASIYVRNSKYEYIRMGLAGSLAQLGTEFFFHPIDVINTRTKAEIVGKINTFNMTRRIYGKDGLYGFCYGLSVTFYGSIIGGMIYFSTYKFFKKLLKKESSEENSSQKNFIAYLFSSCIGEFLFMIVYYPFDLVRTRMQTRVEPHNYKDVLDGFKQIIGKKSYLKGFRRLYTGASPSFILNISNQCLIFSITESLRDYIMLKKNITHVADLGMYDYHTCSVIAGAIAGATTNILEVITINKQIHGKNFHLIKFINEHGFYSFRSGILARMIINTLHTVTLFTIVDSIAHYFGVEL